MAPTRTPSESSGGRSGSSSPVSPRFPSVRSATLPSSMNPPLGAKRIIVCCDGTWQDGFTAKPSKFSNIIKLSRMMEPFDTRVSPPMAQIVFYQSGIGTEPSRWSDLYEGATGASLGMKVQDAYGFIAHNYQPGDEIFLFGFSRGAYTARMTAALIGELGVLDVEDMDQFAEIFIAYSKKSHFKGQKEGKEAEEFLQKFTDAHSKSRLRADADGDSFSVRCIGVFDTVGALGFPSELKLRPRPRSLFGFPDRKLGDHVKYAFHAMALNETRDDFNVTKFEQSVNARLKGQVLRQMWFSGSHSDVGGGYRVHDLSDIALAWMVSQVESILAINTDYVKRLLRPTHPWGTQPPHDPIKGIFQISRHSPRELPKPHSRSTARTARSVPSSPTSPAPTLDYFVPESIHPSVIKQHRLSTELKALIDEHPSLIGTLSNLEEEIVKSWSEIDWASEKKAEVKDAVENNPLSRVFRVVKVLVRLSTRSQGHEEEAHHPDTEKEWINVVSKALVQAKGSGRKNEGEKVSRNNHRRSISMSFRSKRWSRSSVTSSSFTGGADAT